MTDLGKWILELREQNKTYKEISEITGKGKSTISYWCASLDISEELKKKQKDKQDESIRKLNKLVAEKDKDHEWSRKGGFSCQRLHGDKLHKFSYDDCYKSNMNYRKDELPIKLILEKRFNTIFNKEFGNGRYFDFCDNNFVIEYTVDATKGASDAIDRLSTLHDNRKKILITRSEKIGPKRYNRALRGNIEILNVSDFRE